SPSLNFYHRTHREAQRRRNVSNPAKNVGASVTLVPPKVSATSSAPPKTWQELSGSPPAAQSHPANSKPHLPAPLLSSATHPPRTMQGKLPSQPPCLSRRSCPAVRTSESHRAHHRRS